ncbi:MAG: hypothetical protein LBE36_01550 [Flavobacteriaceae bacterium]|jgi:tetratricopeptide (TPR) repeat protein|nr:hypothetical protein [Flavobacteriaceae bacterium]
MKISKKIVLSASVSLVSAFTFAQTLEEGIINIDSHKYAKAKQIFSDMVAKTPSAENYFYLGNAYLTQNEPNFTAAAENFNQGLALDKKSFLNRIGLASVKLGKGDKSGIADIQNIVTESKSKDAEVLFRAGEALTIFEKTNNPDLAVDFITKAIEKVKGGVPAYYYYSLGDAYRLKISTAPQVAGAAMSAYDNALPIAKNKASVYTRMGTLWMAAQKWELAQENINKAIQAAPTYAPAYKARAAYNIRYQENAAATQDLLNYAKYADEDPETQLEISKLFFTNEDYANSKSTLDKIFDKVQDPIKYKLRSYIQYSEGDYADAKESMNTFISQADKSRVLAADQGLLGLIAAGLAKDEADEAKKSALIAESQAKLMIAKNAKDQTLNWDDELAKIVGGITEDAVKTGPTSEAITNLNKKVIENPKDTDALFQLAIEYQNVENWNGAVLTWKKMENLLPDWAPAYYSEGYALQRAGNNEMAKTAYEKFISVVKPEEVAANKDTLAYAYFAVAYLEKDTNIEKAKLYVAKSLELNPTYEDAVNLNQQLSQ